MAAVDVTFPVLDLFLDQSPGLAPSTTYVMRAFESNVVNDYVTWEVDDTPDFVGTFSPWSPGDLSDILVAQVVVPQDVGQAMVAIGQDAAAAGGAGPTSLGAFRFATNDWIPGSTFRLSVVLSTTNVLEAAQLRLYNLTNAEFVNIGGASLLSTSSLGPTIAEGDLEPGTSAGLLRPAATLYELRLESASSSGADIASLDSAFIRVF